MNDRDCKNCRHFIPIVDPECACECWECNFEKDITLQDVKESICDDYCKYKDDAKNRFTDLTEATEYLIAEHCEKCILGRL